MMEKTISSALSEAETFSISKKVKMGFKVKPRAAGNNTAED